MKRLTQLFTLAAAVIGTAASAQAIGVGTAGTPATADITLTGTVQSAVTLTITASGATTFTSSTNNTNAAATAVIDFGNTLQTLTPNVGASNAAVANRTIVGGGATQTGAVWAGQFSVNLQYTGATAGQVSYVQDTAATGSTNDPMYIDVKDTTALLGSDSWASLPTANVLAVPTATATDICPAVTAGPPASGGCASNTTKVVNLGVYVPDTVDTSSGGYTFTDVVVFTATAS